MYRDVLAIVLAGGRGSRLEPLTRDRAKPAVPFGGHLPDHRLHAVELHQLRPPQDPGADPVQGRQPEPAHRPGVEVPLPRARRVHRGDPAPAADRRDWYQGTADAIYQNVYTIEKAAPRDTLILAGDHIYKMNYARMIAYHRDNRADLTIACLPVPRAQAREFGVMGVDDDGRVTSFLEKPKDPPGMPDHPELALASMGIYVFNTDVMYELLFQDAARKEASSHDFGQDIIPAMLAGGSRVFAYPFRDENRKQAAYWRDVGTLDAYFQTNMDLIQIDPILNLYDRDWPIHTLPAAVSAAEVRAHRPRPPGRGVQLDRLPGGDHLGRPGLPQHRLAGRADQQLRPGRGLDPLRRRRGRPPRPHPPRDHRQGRARSPPASRSAGTARPTSPAASPSPRRASPSSPRAKTWSGSGRVPGSDRIPGPIGVES